MKRILMMFALCMMLGSLVGALEFDNVKTYDAVTREVTITNLLGLGSEIGKARLNTPLNVKVGAGYQKVAEFDIYAYSDYSDSIKDFQLIDLKTGKNIERKIDVKYKTIQEVAVDDFGNVCRDEYSKVNDTTYKNCYYEKIGSHYEKKEVWLDFPKEMKEGVYTIGLFTDVQAGDRVDWIPSIYGVKVEEWASWEASLSVNLILYFKLDEMSGAVIDSTNYANGTNDGALPNQTGKINTAYYLNANTDSINTSKGSAVMGNAPRTINMWINLDASVGNQQFYSYGNLATAEYFGIRQHLSSGKLDFMNVGGPDAGSTSNFTINAGGWFMVTMVYNGTTVFLYGNGSSSYMGTQTLNTKDTYFPGIGCALGDSYACGMIGKADELAIWNRTLSYTEIQQLWNNGAGLGYLSSDVTPDAPPLVTINAPANANYTAQTNVNVNCTASDDWNLSAVKLYINGGLNQTNATGLNNTNYIFTLPLYDGDYNLSCKAEDNASQTTDSATRRIMIDSSLPVINILYPESKTYYDDYVTSNTKQITLNWTATDSFLSTCWYYNGTANTTVTCNTNQTLNVTYKQLYNFQFFANDTSGNVGMKTANTTWDYVIKLNSVKYNPTTEVGRTEPFELNVSYNSSIYTNSQGVLYWNGTAYSGSRNDTGGDVFVFYKSVDIPSTSGVASFYWNVSLTNSTGTYYYPLTSYNQTISLIRIDNCGSYTHPILNYTIYDEDTLIKINATAKNLTTKAYIRLSASASGTVYGGYNFTSTDNPVRICSENNLTIGESYTLESEVQFTADQYVTEHYYIVNKTINSTTVPYLISLYLITEDRSQEFLLTFKDSNFIPVQNALIEITRQYLSLGDTYITVENMKTDRDGLAVAHLVLDEEMYTINVYKDGILRATYQNVIAFCSNLLTGDCKINLNELGSTSSPSNFNTYLGITGAESWNDTTKTFIFTFSTADGTNKHISVNITKSDNYKNQTICSGAVTIASGTINCVIPSAYYNSTGIARVYVDGSLYSTTTVKISNEELLLSVSRYILAFILILTFPLLALGSPEMVLVFFVLGVFGAGLFALLNLGNTIGIASALIYLIIAVGILIYKINSERK